jgi:hypothetical protein
MGEPIAGRISEEAKGELEYVAEQRNTSVSDLVGSIVEIWIRDRRMGEESDPDEAESESFDKSLQEVYDELEAVRWFVQQHYQTTSGNLQTWAEIQVMEEERGYSELEQRNVTTVDNLSGEFRR